MALAIVPPDCNSDAVTDDFTALVHELMAEEHVTEVEANTHALELTDALYAYAASWDADACRAGNPHIATNTTPPGIVIDLAPSPSRQLVLNE